MSSSIARIEMGHFPKSPRSLYSVPLNQNTLSFQKVRHKQIITPSNKGTNSPGTRAKRHHQLQRSTCIKGKRHNGHRTFFHFENYTRDSISRHAPIQVQNPEQVLDGTSKFSLET